MATKITKWVAKDGSEHLSELAADRHDVRMAAKRRVDDAVSDLTTYNSIDPDQLLERLYDPTSELSVALHEYRKAL